MTATQDGMLTGITSQEASQRLAADGPNELPAARKRNLLQQAWDVVRQPIMLLLVGAGIVNLLLSEPLDAIILMSFVIVVIAISIYEEHKTENALAALRDLSSPRALWPMWPANSRSRSSEAIRINRFQSRGGLLTADPTSTWLATHPDRLAIYHLPSTLIAFGDSVGGGSGRVASSKREAPLLGTRETGDGPYGGRAFGPGLAIAGAATSRSWRLVDGRERAARPQRLPSGC